MDRKFRKILSIVLSLALISGVCAVAACADEGEAVFPMKKSYEIDGYTLYATLYDDDNDGVGDFWRIDNSGTDAADPDVEPNVDLAAFYGRNNRAQMKKFAEALYNDPDFDNDSRSLAGMTTELQEHYELYKLGVLVDHTKTTDMGQTRFDHNAYIFENYSASWELAAFATVVETVISYFRQVFGVLNSLFR